MRDAAVDLAAREVLFERGATGDAEASVCVTLYNYDGCVLDALESVYDQTLEALGLVVLDDRSTDEGPARVERWMRAYAGRFAGVRLARHERNQGLARARNGAVDLAESDAVMILDADNQLYPRCVERLLRSLEGSPFGFAYSILEQFDEHVGLMGCASWDPKLLERENYIDAMALIRKDTWRTVGGYTRMSVTGWEDYDFWCKCVEAGVEGLFVPEILARYRLHGSSMLRTETDLAANRARVRREMCERHPWLDEGESAGTA